MLWCVIVISFLSSGLVHGGSPFRKNEKEVEEDLTLPEDLLIGAGLSAYQAEGAVDVGGKGVSLMDYSTHSNSSIFKGLNGDVAADHYHRYKEDLELAQKMKLTSHRFSISWTRIFPTGNMSQEPNAEGVQFYQNYIQEVINRGMTPMVTMLHFDQPWVLEEAFGWGNPLMVEAFVAYADALFRLFGDKVKLWNTINEPNMFCNYYNTIMGSFSVDNPMLFKCMHHMILAHAKTYRLYHSKYSNQGGRVGAALLFWPAHPASTSVEDVNAAEVFTQLFSGSIAHPVVFGDYPEITRYLVDKWSAENGQETSRLPRFSPEEKEILSGGCTDFLAVNVYNSYSVSRQENSSKAEVPILLGPMMQYMPFVELSGHTFSGQIDESLLHDTLLWLWNTYHKPIIVAENGLADQTGMGVRDMARASYFSANLRSLVRTTKKYAIPVIAFYAWSLIDVFEFSAGYTQRRFGLIYVDYENSSLPRTLKDSSSFFTQLMTERRVPYVSASMPAFPAPPLVLTLAAAALLVASRS